MKLEAAGTIIRYLTIVRKKLIESFSVKNKHVFLFASFEMDDEFPP